MNRYGTTPKGIAGSIGGGLFRQPDSGFNINVKDPFSPMNREIDPTMIRPKKKFDTIMEEYIAVRSQFDAMKKNIGKAGGNTGGDSKA